MNGITRSVCECWWVCLYLLCRCGKLLRSDADIASHVARTGHTQFAESTQEIKPLTEEEKKEKLKQLVTLT